MSGYLGGREMVAEPYQFPPEKVEQVPFAPEQAREADVARLLQYWASLRQGSALPLKDALDPGEFGKILSAVTILERLAPDNYLIRLFATMLTERYGRDATGENHIDLVPETMREALQLLYADCLDGPCVYLVHQKMTGGDGLVLEAEFATLPLADPGGQAKFILTASRSAGGPDSDERLMKNFAGELSHIEIIGVKRLSLD